jgi:hypothetical protein
MSAQFLFGILIVLGYVVCPVVLIWGWTRWAVDHSEPRTIYSILSLMSFILATVSAVLAVLTVVYAQIHHFRYYDPTLLRIFRCGFLDTGKRKHISKEGDPYLRTLLVQGAHHILGPFGADSDLRRWGLKLAERGGKNGKKRAVIATARKLAVLLHRLWVSGEAYEPLRNSRAMRLPAAA